jgi:periplasmic copper chaperone A
MIRSFACVVLLVWASAGHGQVQVKDAWARPALQGQTATGAFMSLTSSDGARLIGAASPVAGVVEIHEMVMEGSVMDLKRPLKAGERVPLELRLETKDKRLVTQPIEVEVATRAPAAASSAGHKH